MDTVDILNDVTFQKDIKGPALFVFWRNVPVGFIRPLTDSQIASRARKVPAGERKALRDYYRERVGKWYDSLSGERYFDTKEEAAHDLVLRVLRQMSHSPLIQPALLGDGSNVPWP